MRGMTVVHLLWLHKSIACLVLTVGYGFDYITLYGRDNSAMLSLFSQLKDR